MVKVGFFLSLFAIRYSQPTKQEHREKL